MVVLVVLVVVVVEVVVVVGRRCAESFTLQALWWPQRLRRCRTLCVCMKKQLRNTVSKSCGRLREMAKSKNHTSHNQSNKAHKNGIKRTLRQKHQSCRGMDPKFLRNQRCDSCPPPPLPPSLPLLSLPLLLRTSSPSSHFHVASSHLHAGFCAVVAMGCRSCLL